MQKDGDEKKQITIIVPVFQVEEYLDQCISSIVRQNYDNLEIILVDDGATDNSTIICDKYQAVDTRIKVIHKTNGGLSHARNAGLKLATGDFIGFVDSDDWIEPNMVEVLVSALQETGADIAVCNHHIESSDSMSQQISTGTLKRNLYSSKEALKMILNLEGFIGNIVWNKLYRKNILQDINFPEGKIFEDTLWTAQVIGKSRTLTCIDYPLYHYLYRADSLSHNNLQLRKRLWRKIEMCEQRIKYIRKHHPEFEKLALLNLQDFCYWQYIKICLNYDQYDADGKIRYDLYQYFRQMGVGNIILLGNFRTILSKILFLISPCLFMKIYGAVKRI